MSSEKTGKARSAPTAEQDREDLAVTFFTGAVIDGKYRIQSVVGRGSMGIVFLAIDETLERKVAIKVLTGATSTTAEGHRLFHYEAVAMARVRHTNVVQVFSVGREGGHSYLVMDYVDGTGLDTYLLRNGRPHTDVALGILRQVAAGLDAIHAEGLVHRDVKPANILIGPQYDVQLVDFGLVGIAGGPWADRIAGTPSYLAPELVVRDRSDGSQPHLGDIYALGICAFELFTGRRPFSGDDSDEILTAQVEIAPPAPSTVVDDLSDQYDEPILKALGKDASERWLSASAFVTELSRRHDRLVEEQRNTGLTVLAVEDDPDQQAIYRIVFESAFEDAHLQTAKDGLSAIELIRANPPDLILLDLNMPTFNGLELVSLLKQNEDWSEIPLMVISAEATRSNMELLQAFGVTEFHRKPISPATLVRSVRAMTAVAHAATPESGQEGSGDLPAGPDDVAETIVDSEPKKLPRGLRTRPEIPYRKKPVRGAQDKVVAPSEHPPDRAEAVEPLAEEHREQDMSSTPREEPQTTASETETRDSAQVLSRESKELAAVVSQYLARTSSGDPFYVLDVSPDDGVEAVRSAYERFRGALPVDRIHILSTEGQENAHRVGEAVHQAYNSALTELLSAAGEGDKEGPASFSKASAPQTKPGSRDAKYIESLRMHAKLGRERAAAAQKARNVRKHEIDPGEGNRTPQGYARAYLAEANRLAKRRKWADALQIIREAGDAMPHSAAIISLEAWILFNVPTRDKEKQLEVCAERLTVAITLLESYSDAHYYLGLVRQAQCRYKDAYGCFQRALQLDPTTRAGAIGAKLKSLEKLGFGGT